MQQLEIQYFFPLTEQVPLDLDFKPCEEHAKKLQEERWKNSISVTSGSYLIGSGLTGTSWTTVSNNLGAPSFTINVDAMPITIVSKKKPNFIMKFIYKSMGMKWKSE
jgi:hypothetical protein